jgi:hypothetical protein
MRFTALERCQVRAHWKTYKTGSDFWDFLPSTSHSLQTTQRTYLDAHYKPLPNDSYFFLCLTCATLLFSPVLHFSRASPLLLPGASTSPLVLFPATRKVLTAPPTKPAAKSVASSSIAQTKPAAARNWACKMPSLTYWPLIMMSLSIFDL